MMEWLRELPLYVPKIIATLIFIGVTVWAWMRPKSFIYEGAPNKKMWRDLRLWITGMMAVQIFLYWYF
jgi:hypothetical protein